MKYIVAWDNGYGDGKFCIVTKTYDDEYTDDDGYLVLGEKYKTNPLYNRGWDYDGYGRWFKKIPTAIANVGTVDMGEQENYYRFNGEEYVVGELALLKDPINTMDFENFLKPFSGLILFDFLKTEGLLSKVDEIEFRLGLSHTDWGKSIVEGDKVIKESSANVFYRSMKEITVSHKVFTDKGYVWEETTIHPKITLTKQGVGVAKHYLHEMFNPKEHLDKRGNPMSMPEWFTVIDIGFNTINALMWHNGIFLGSESNGYINRGVSVAIYKLQKELESIYGTPFDIHTTKKIFVEGTYSMAKVPKHILEREDYKKSDNTIKVEEAIDRIGDEYIDNLILTTFSKEFREKMFKSTVIFAGGGANLMEKIHNKWSKEDGEKYYYMTQQGEILYNWEIINMDKKEFSNVYGFTLDNNPNVEKDFILLDEVSDER